MPSEVMWALSRVMAGPWAHPLDAGGNKKKKKKLLSLHRR